MSCESDAVSSLAPLEAAMRPSPVAHRALFFIPLPAVLLCLAVGASRAAWKELPPIAATQGELAGLADKSRVGPEEQTGVASGTHGKQTPRYGDCETDGQFPFISEESSAAPGPLRTQPNQQDGSELVLLPAG